MANETDVKWMGALRTLMMAGLSALICGVIVALGTADYGFYNGQGSMMKPALIAFLVAVVVLMGLLTLGQLYGYLFAKWGWLSLRNTILVGVIAQAMVFYIMPNNLGAEGDGWSAVRGYLTDLFLGTGWKTGGPTSETVSRIVAAADWMDRFFGETTELIIKERITELGARISTVAQWIRKALITSPASIGLVLFYALHLRHKKGQPSVANP